MAGLQPFGGWKGSGSTGKGVGALYYGRCTSTSSRARSWSADGRQFLSLAAAIEQYVQDGSCIALEGFTHLIPFAAGHEIIRQRRRLHLVRMTPDHRL